MYTGFVLLCVTSLVTAYGSDVASLVQSQVAPTQEKPAPASAAQGAAVEQGADTGTQVQSGADVDVESLVSKPEAVFKEMSAQVGSLSDEMSKIHQQNQLAISNQQATFNKKLEEQKKVNHDMSEANDGLSDEVQKLTTSNRQLWQHGKGLQTENERQRAVIKGMQAKIADASEFATDQMKALADIDDADEKVIRELDALDMSHQEDAAHKQNLDMIATIGSQKVSMLESDGNIDPSLILKVMQESLAHMDEEQKASENELKAIFLKKFEAEAMEHKKLVAESSRLSAKKASLTEMHTRLETAFKHLEDVRDKLRSVITSLGTFSEKIGKDALEEARIVAKADSEDKSKHVEAAAPPAALAEEAGVKVSSGRVLDANVGVHEHKAATNGDGHGLLKHFWTRLTGT